MASVANDERDTRPRLIFKSYGGKKGPEFEPWVVGFLDAAEGKGDDANFDVCGLRSLQGRMI